MYQKKVDWTGLEWIILRKGQLDHSYTFWTMPIMIFSPVYFFLDTLYVGSGMCLASMPPWKKLSMQLKPQRTTNGQEWREIPDKKTVFFSKIFVCLSYVTALAKKRSLTQISVNNLDQQKKWRPGFTEVVNMFNFTMWKAWKHSMLWVTISFHEYIETIKPSIFLLPFHHLASIWTSLVV